MSLLLYGIFLYQTSPFAAKNTYGKAKLIVSSSRQSVFRYLFKGGMKMKYRHEYKHEISLCDAAVLRSRLSVVMQRDSHAIDGKYFIRSLYFDNSADKALNEKINGVNIREKFRIRYYNFDTSVIHLEKKSKINGLCLKQSASLTKEEAQAIADGDCQWMLRSGNPLLQELYSKMKSQGLRPKTIVDYEREPFVFAPGNVRVTLDCNIRTGINCTDFLNPDCVTVPAGNSVILEVKWDEFLPDIIRDAVQLPSCRTGTYSKYAVCRCYG